jgi:ferrous iron transport protein A
VIARGPVVQADCGCSWRTPTEFDRDQYYCERLAKSAAIWQRWGVTLDQIPLGTRARITAVDWSLLAVDEVQRLRALGIEPDAQVTVAHRGIFAGRDPLAVQVGRMTVALRRVHARAMSVEPV